MKDLTVSNIERQNVLNNRFAINKIQEQLDITAQKRKMQTSKLFGIR